MAKRRIRRTVRLVLHIPTDVHQRLRTLAAEADQTAPRYARDVLMRQVGDLDNSPSLPRRVTPDDLTRPRDEAMARLLAQLRSPGAQRTRGRSVGGAWEWSDPETRVKIDALQNDETHPLHGRYALRGGPRMLSDEQVEPKWRARAAAVQVTYGHAVADLDWRASRVVAYRGFTSEYVTTIAGVIATMLQDQLVGFAKRLTAALPGTSVMSALDVLALLDSQIAWGGAFDVLRGVLLQQVTTTNRTLTWLGLFIDRRRREKRPDPFAFSAFETAAWFVANHPNNELVPDDVLTGLVYGGWHKELFATFRSSTPWAYVWDAIRREARRRAGSALTDPAVRRFLLETFLGPRRREMR
jgi:hypothetical protein